MIARGDGAAALAAEPANANVAPASGSGGPLAQSLSDSRLLTIGGSLWLPLAPSGSLWLPLAPSGSLWLLWTPRRSSVRLPPPRPCAPPSAPQRASIPIWLENVQCGGEEASLAECGHDGWGSTDCSHSEDIHLLCAVPRRPPPPPPTAAASGAAPGAALMTALALTPLQVGAADGH